MSKSVELEAATSTAGRVLHAARLYDLVAWLLLRGREREFRERTLDLAHLTAGESVLDVGCGTGTLAIAAKGRVGPSGAVCGIDASPEMVARARHKAERSGVQVSFRNAAIEALPWPDGSFDVVLSTLMLHHLPRPVRSLGAREVRRVLKPGGRVLAVDFAVSSREQRGLLAHFHRHGRVNLGEVIEVFREAGLDPVESGPVGTRDLHFLLAAALGGRG